MFCRDVLQSVYPAAWQLWEAAHGVLRFREWVNHQQKLVLLAAGLRWARSSTSSVYFTQKLSLES